MKNTYFLINTTIKKEFQRKYNTLLDSFNLIRRKLISVQIKFMSLSKSWGYWVADDNGVHCEWPLMKTSGGLTK